MTIKEKINRKNFKLVICYTNGKRVGYFAKHKIYERITNIYKTQKEVLNALKNI